jgi:tetratricopeptide (TPR) repeat protein
MKVVEQLLDALYKGTDSGKHGRTAYNSQIQPVLLLNAGLNLRFGRYRWARIDLERYLQIQPENARAHFLLGESFRQQGGKTRVKNALKCYREAIRLDGSYVAPQKALGMLYFKQGRKHLARRFFQTALALSPDDKDSVYLADYLAECLSKGEP